MNSYEQFLFFFFHFFFYFCNCLTQNDSKSCLTFVTGVGGLIAATGLGDTCIGIFRLVIKLLFEHVAFVCILKLMI